jgi:hypothetical protein
MMHYRPWAAGCAREVPRPKRRGTEAIGEPEAAGTEAGPCTAA